MGAWGISNFENDDALDFIYDFEENPTIEYLLTTIKEVFEDGFLDLSYSSRALAAIEIIAAILDNPSSDIPDFETINFNDLKTHKNSISENDLNFINKSLDRILDSEENELYDLYEESESLNEWKDIVQDLKNRINK